MHRDNPYLRQRPDFASLAKQYPPLAPYVTVTATDAHLDFSDANALRALTTALLHSDFGLTVNLRDDRLCPTLANRLDYVLLCLDLTKYAPSQPQPLRALDIGTGHVAIYALLLSHYGVDVIASELDATSREHAESTVQKNGITNISIRPPPPDSSLLGYLDESTSTSSPTSTSPSTSFTLCNPPFFSSTAEASSSRTLKPPPPAAPTASANEEITEGGEESFVSRMVDESVKTNTRCNWYTSLIGRYASLPSILGRIKKVTSNYYVVQLRQSRTTRWVVIWGFTGYRLPDSLTRPEHLDERTSYARLLPLPNMFRYCGSSVSNLVGAVLPVLSEVGLFDGEEEEAVANGITLAPVRNTWSRAARRAARRGSVEVEGGGDPLFRALLSFKDGDGEATLCLEWTFGHDRDVVDAFWKFLVAKAGLGKRAREAEGDNARRGQTRTPRPRTRDNGWNMYP